MIMAIVCLFVVVVVVYYRFRLLCRSSFGHFLLCVCPTFLKFSLNMAVPISEKSLSSQSSAPLLTTEPDQLVENTNTE